MRPISRRQWTVSLLIILLAAAHGSTAESTPDPAAVAFDRDVHPILAAHCFACHGADKREGGLRLDARQPALEGGDSGRAIEPGKPDSSSLLDRVISNEEGERMPPEGDPLTADQIAVLRRWIEQGADWPRDSDSTQRASAHWAFQPIAWPGAPAADASHAIDRFVQAPLRAKGITSSPRADRHTLLRRLSLDLTGLPPTVEQIDEFLADTSPEAYEHLVDRLLESPHFGERWAMQWLDLARYADSDGYEKDLPRPHAYRWRDWVIDAINRDLPFDQFTVQQLAGDLLPGATTPVQLATGFHRNTLTNREGGVDQEEFRVAAAIDRNNTTFAVWMGLTAGCAQCHTHKYDPLTQREYYRLYAFFNEADERDLNVEPDPLQLADFERQLASHNARLAELKAEFEAEQPALIQRLDDWLAQQRRELEGIWTPLEVVRRAIRDDGTHEILARTTLSRVTALRLQIPPIGREDWNGRVVISQIQITAQPKGESDAGPLWISRADADTAGGQQGIRGILDADRETGWIIDQPPQQTLSVWLATADEPGRPGFLGNPLSDGSQDGATNLLNVYYQSPLPAPGTVDKIRVYSKAVANAKFGAYLLRPDGGGFRVIYRQDFTAGGSTGEKDYELTPAWQVQPGDVFAHSGNGGPTFGGGNGTKDMIYFPLSKLPQQEEIVSIGKLPSIASRTYAMQANFIPAPPPKDFVKPQWTDDGATLTVSLTVPEGSAAFDDLRLAATDQPQPLDSSTTKLPAEIIALVRAGGESLDGKQREQLLAYFVTIDEVGKRLKGQIDAHQKTAPKKPAAIAHVMQQSGPRPTHVHMRGNFLEKGDEVQPGTPDFLPPLEPRDRRLDRLDLARWIMSPENPLTARVAVNHVWAALFGQGLVRTTDDFGTQGEPPSHPKLLDWLASEYPRLGWSRKRLIKVILLSDTYQQSSHTRQDLVEIDPENRLLARQNRFRLEAELVRDQYLAAANLLQSDIGGPSFRPPLPDSVTRVQFVNQWKSDSGGALYRRGLYIHLQRNLMLPMLMTFDRPEAILSCTRRDRSNTPLQALTLLNAPTFVDSARELAVQVTQTEATENASIVQLFLRIVARSPSEFETKRVSQLLDELTAYYDEHQDDARKLAGETLAARVEAADGSLAQAAAWVAVCRTVLNMDEMIMRE